MMSRDKRIDLAAVWAAVLLPLAGGCSSVQWEHDYDRGMQKALQARSRALVQFHSNISGECMKMDQDVLADSDVQKLLGKYVLIRVDTLLNKPLADQFDIAVVPAFIVFRPSQGGMQVVSVHKGAMDKEAFRYFLIKNSLY